MTGEVIVAIIGAIIFCLISSACNCAIYIELNIKRLKKELQVLQDNKKSPYEDDDLKKY